MEEKIKFGAMWLSLICLLIFIVQLLIPNFTENFMLTSKAIYRPWQFLTSIFLHADISHLIYNLFALLLFGTIAERLIGTKRFLFLFFCSGIIANLISFSFYPNSLGASAAIMAVLGLAAILKPGMTVFAFGMIMPMFILAIIWAAGSIMGLFGIGEQNIGYLAHLIGLLLGFVYGLILKFNRPSAIQISRKRIALPENYMRYWENTHIK